MKDIKTNFAKLIAATVVMVVMVSLIRLAITTTPNQWQHYVGWIGLFPTGLWSYNLFFSD